MGLYVDPPADAIVLSVDEKSQIQALSRTEPGLPPKKGRARTDYERHGSCPASPSGTLRPAYELHFVKRRITSP